jgi:hypothetical protein
MYVGSDHEDNGGLGSFPPSSAPVAVERKILGLETVKICNFP